MIERDKEIEVRTRLAAAMATVHDALTDLAYHMVCEYDEEILWEEHGTMLEGMLPIPTISLKPRDDHDDFIDFPWAVSAGTIKQEPIDQLETAMIQTVEQWVKDYGSPDA